MDDLRFDRSCVPPFFYPSFRAGPFLAFFFSFPLRVAGVPELPSSRRPPHRGLLASLSSTLLLPNLPSGLFSSLFFHEIARDAGTAHSVFYQFPLFSPFPSSRSFPPFFFLSMTLSRSGGDVLPAAVLPPHWRFLKSGPRRPLVFLPWWITPFSLSGAPFGWHERFSEARLPFSIIPFFSFLTRCFLSSPFLCR